MAEHYSALKGKHKGKPAVLVCNGPGLKSVSTEFLTRYPTLGCNRITMRYPEFCPTYYFEMGGNHLNSDEKRATMLPVIMDERCEAAFINRLMFFEFQHIGKCYSWLGGRAYGATGHELTSFSMAPFRAVGLGFTMAFPILQIAYWIGWDPILIVGMDHEYPDTKSKHFYDDDERYAALFEVAPGPYSNEAWRAGADRVLQKCRDEYDKAGRRIINLSEPTKCDIFERGRLEDW
jgi:hypothetical protein